MTLQLKLYLLIKCLKMDITVQLLVSKDNMRNKISDYWENTIRLDLRRQYENKTKLKMHINVTITMQSQKCSDPNFDELTLKDIIRKAQAKGSTK